MIKFYNKLFPFPSFIAMVTLFILWIRSEYRGTTKLSKDFFRHEKIHCIQQCEIVVLSFVVMFVLVISLDISAWWLLLSILIPFAIYFLCFLLEIVIPPYNQAYKNICFETEAIYNEWDDNYFKRRVPFSFLKYVSNKKYPYLTKYQRQKRSKLLRETKF